MGDRVSSNKPFLGLLYFCLLIITRLRYVYASTVDGTGRNYSSSPVLIIIFAARTAINEL